MPSLHEVLRSPSGAIWLKADLHVHTPGSADFHDSATPEDIVRVAVDRGLSILAITDHNTGSWCDRVSQAAKGTALTVFPGVEISTHQGHILAIFDVDTPAGKIDDLLIKLIPREQIGSLDAVTSYGVVEVSNLIEEAGAVAIAAHVDGDRGFLKTIAVAGERKRAYQAPNLRGLEIVDPSLRDTYQKGVRAGYTRKMACVQSSDCTSPGSGQHLLANIGSRYSFIKMGQRTISGLKLALIDPEMRIRLPTDAEPTPRTAMVAMWTTGGFLNGQLFHFSDNVTCLIGDTGAGKSVALELIRFCLDYPPTVAKIRTETDRLLSQQLGNLGTVHMIIRKDESYYLVERTWGSPPTPPSVSRLTEDRAEPIEGPIAMHLFFPIKAFSQSEIIEYAREPEVRLSLTDDLIDCTSEKALIAQLKGSLKENAATYIAEKSKEQNILAQLAELPTLTESLTQLDTILDDERIKQHQQWYTERTILANATRQFAALASTVEASGKSLQLDPPLEQKDTLNYPNPDLLTKLLTIYTRWQDFVKAQSDSISKEATKVSEESAALRATWNVRFDKAQSEYQLLLAEIDKDGRGLQALSERRQQIETQITDLKMLQRRLETEVLPRVSSLYSDREKLLDELQAQRIAITNKRRNKAQELTTKLNNAVRLHVSARSSKARFRFAVEQLGRGSNTRSADYDQITDRCHPIPFVKQLAARDYAGLAAQTGVDTSRFDRLMDFIADRNLVDQLYELQTTDIDDEIEVMLQVAAGTYKRIEDLAHGQKCMVILMIALAEGDFPLVVDQPEDALHAPGIELGIVSTLRFRRGIRQCLFATRNANIIVSADAEQILPLNADATHGELVGCGCLDNFDQKNLVLYHVEGGEEAFSRRQTMYYLKPTA